MKIPLSKVENSRKNFIRSNKMLLPIVENNKLVDFIHTKELFTEKNHKENLSCRRSWLYRVHTS